MTNNLTQNDRSDRGKAYLVAALGLIAMIFCTGFNTTSLSILLPSWSEEMGFTTGEYGLMAGAIAMGVVWTCWVTAPLLDRFNPKYMMTIAIAINGLSVFFRGYISDFTTAYIALFITGMANGMIIPGCMKMINVWFDARLTYRLNGINISGGAIGYFIGFNGTLPWAEALGGWDKLFQLFGVIILVLAVVYFFAIPTRTEAEGVMNRALGIKTEEYTFGRKLKEALSSKQIIVCALCEFFFAGAILTFSSVGPLAFISIWEGLSTEDAGFMISMSNIGSSIGYWVMPLVADKVFKGARKKAMIPMIIFASFMYPASAFTGNILASCVMINIAGLSLGFALIAPRTLAMEHPDCAGVKAGITTGMLTFMNKLGCVVSPLIFTTIMAASGALAGWVAMFAIGGVGGVICLALATDTAKMRKAALAKEAEAKEGVA